MRHHCVTDATGSRRKCHGTSRHYSRHKNAMTQSLSHHTSWSIECSSMVKHKRKGVVFFLIKKNINKCNFIIFRLIHNWIVMNCYWPVEIPIKETNETKSFGFREKIARQFKNAKHVNTVFQIQLFFSHVIHIPTIRDHSWVNTIFSLEIILF